MRCDVLAALMREGMTVTLLRHDGTAVGFCLPVVPRIDDVAQFVEEAALTAEWPSVLEAFRAAEERRVVLSLAKRLGLTLRDPRRGSFERRLIELAQLRLVGGAPLCAEELMARLDSPLLRAELVQALARHGIGARFQDPRLPERNIAGLAHAALGLKLSLLGTHCRSPPISANTAANTAEEAAGLSATT